MHKNAQTNNGPLYTGFIICINNVGTYSHQSALISNQHTDDPLDFRHAEQNLGYRNCGYKMIVSDNLQQVEGI